MTLEIKSRSHVVTMILCSWQGRTAEFDTPRWMRLGGGEEWLDSGVTLATSFDREVTSPNETTPFGNL